MLQCQFYVDCWPHSSIKIMMCKNLYFAHFAHSGCFVNKKYLMSKYLYLAYFRKNGQNQLFSTKSVPISWILFRAAPWYWNNNSYMAWMASPVNRDVANKLKVVFRIWRVSTKRLNSYITIQEIRESIGYVFKARGGIHFFQIQHIIWKNSWRWTSRKKSACKSDLAFWRYHGS